MTRTYLLLLCAVLLLAGSFLAAQAQNWEWAVGAGGLYEDYGYALALDGAGNIYTTGFFSGTAAFGPFSLITSPSGSDIFVTKQDPGGNYLWARQAGGLGADLGSAVTVDAGGNILITGNYSCTAFFGAIELADDPDSAYPNVFVAKLDPSGSWLWACQAFNAHGSGISSDSSGNAYLTGFFWETTQFGGFTFSSYGLDDIFVAKLDANGNWLWANRAGGPDSDLGSAITLDPGSYPCVAGAFSGTAQFGASALTSAGNRDIFAAKLDGNGNWLWTRRAGGEEWDIGTAIASDSESSLYLTGQFSSEADFGAHALSSGGNADIFAAKISGSGTWLWAARAGSPEADAGLGIAVENTSRVFITGYFRGNAGDPAVFGDTELVSSGAHDVFAASLDGGGYWLWAIRGGGTGGDYGRGIVSASESDVYVTGNFQGPAAFNGSSLPCCGISDVFVAKLTFAEPTIRLISPNVLNFGQVCVEEGSDYLPIVFEAEGIAPLSILDLHFTGESQQFEIMEQALPLLLQPGERDSVMVRFLPQAIGALCDTLSIVNNSLNQPRLRIRLAGTGVMVPLEAPQNVNLSMDGYNALVSWDPVTQNTHQQPVEPDYYFVYHRYMGDETLPFYFLAPVTDTHYIHFGVGLGPQPVCYQVTAVKFYRGEDIPGYLEAWLRRDGAVTTERKE